MSLNFPNTPVTGDIFPDPPQPGAPAWRWDGTKWVLLASAGSGGGGIEDAKHDGVLYGRKDGAWESVDDAIAGAGSGIPDADADGVLYGRKDGAWASIDDAIESAVAPLRRVSFSFVIPGKPPVNVKYNVPIVFPCSIAASTTESKGIAETAPTLAWHMWISKIVGGSEQNAGTVTIATSGVVTVQTVANELAPGDVLRLTPLDNVDATLADVGISILARRT